MWWLEQIITYLSQVRDWFLDAYYEVSGWVYPFNNLATPLYWLYHAFFYLAFHFGSFNAWVDDAASKIAAILNFDNLYSYFRTYFDYAVNAWNWVFNAWNNVIAITGDWWNSTQLIVQSWIASAQQFLQTQINGINTLLASIQASVDNLLSNLPTLNEIISWWSNWWGNTLANLGSWWNDRLYDVQGLINSAFVERESLWAGWQDFRGKVVEFFTDPWGWLYDRFDDFIERFW